LPHFLQAFEIAGAWKFSRIYFGDTTGAIGSFIKKPAAGTLERIELL